MDRAQVLMIVGGIVIPAIAGYWVRGEIAADVARVENGLVVDGDAGGVVYRVSAYCAGPCCCGRFADGVTSSGHVIAEGDRFCAAALEIPFGTVLEIPGYNEGQGVPVLDRGGAVRGRRLDVYFETHAEALAWGVRILEVKVKGGE